MKLNLPHYTFNIKPITNGYTIFDPLRKQFVKLTPEEWVRQNFVMYLQSEKKFPAALMGNEISLNQNGINRRCDTLIVDHTGKPLVIVEYKAPSIEITEKVFDQIARYNSVLQAKYLIVSNGIVHYCCKFDTCSHKYLFLKEIPNYSDLD